jgi:TonB family protein
MQSPKPAAAPPAAVVVEDPVLEEAKEWIGRALILRGFYSGTTLIYDSRGHIAGEPPKSVDWTLAGMNLDKVSRDGEGRLVLEGPRVAIRYNADGRQFERHAQKDEPLRVILPAADAAAVRAALPAIFAIGIDPAVERAAASCWQHFFFPANGWTGPDNLGAVISVPGTTAPPGVVMPVMEVRNEPPPITGEAQRDRVRGTVQVRVAVGPDGVPRQITIRQPLGYGLDVRTADAVAKSRFRPGTRDGKPVAIEMIVNQPFEVSPPTGR